MRPDIETEIRAWLEDWVEATRAKDVDAIMACHAPATLSFDCHSRLQLAGAAALRKHLEACMPCMQGPMTFEIHDLDVAAHGDVAFCRCLARYGATGLGGEEHAGWLRVTTCLRKLGGQWLIVHDHCSTPFDARSGKALLDLAPELPDSPAGGTAMNRTEPEMTLHMSGTDEEAQIRELIHAWAKAARAKDLEAIFSYYAPDISAFDAIAELQFKGQDAYRKHWKACMAMCPGAMIFEVHDLSIAAQGDVAFCHYLTRCGEARADGEEQAGWMRATAGLRKRNGKWLVVHEHFSAPFDPASGQALLGLAPQHPDRTRAA